MKPLYAILCVIFLLAGDVIASPREAQAVALSDLKGVSASDKIVSPSDYRYLRYLWVADGKPRSAKLASLTCNIVGRGAIITRPEIVGMTLIRVDLRHYAATTVDLEELIALWEEFVFDPFFSTIITRDTLANVLRDGRVIPEIVEVGQTRLRVKCKPYQRDGETFDTKWVDALRLPGHHLDQRVNAELVRLTGSAAPVVHHQYFAFRALSTIKDKGLYATVFGGLYYELAGLSRSKDAKFTDEDLLFEALGVGDTKLGLTAEVIYERVKSDRRAAMFRSKVTSKPRTVDFLKSLQGKDEAAVLVTHDLRDQDIDIGKHAIMNLLKLSPNPDRSKARAKEAREIIFTKRDGLHGFALVNDAGTLAESAPEDVVVDHLIPAPFTRRLQGAISCLRCHGVDGSDGIKAVTNDVQALVKSGLDIFGDVSDLNQPTQETLDRLAGQYALNPDKTIRRVREDYLEAILRATGPWKEDGDQTGVGKLMSEGFADLFDDWWYSGVDARKMLTDLGYPALPKEQAVVFFKALVPPDVSSKVPVAFLGIAAPISRVPEDPRIAALGAGLTISRADAALIYSFVAARAQATETRLAQKKEKK